MAQQSHSGEAEATAEEPNHGDGDVQARIEALRRYSCWGAWHPAGAASRHRSTPAFVRRGLWAENWKRSHQSAPSCVVCGRLWTPRTGDLHEQSPTASLSAFDALVPMCWAHHTALHDVIRATRAADRLDYREATRDGLLHLRSRQVEFPRR